MAKESLKKVLNDWIQIDGKVSYEDVDQYCKANFYRIGTACRRLRQSESPNIIPILKKGYIIGWKFEEVIKPKQESLFS